MGQRLRLAQQDEPWVVHTVDEATTACIEVLSIGFKYKNFRVIKYELVQEFGKYKLKERSLPGRSTTYEDNQVKRWSKLEDGIYRLEWAEASYDEEWNPIQTFFGSNWRILDSKFKGLKIKQKLILKELIAFEQRRMLALVDDGIPILELQGEEE